MTSPPPPSLLLDLLQYWCPCTRRDGANYILSMKYYWELQYASTGKVLSNCPIPHDWIYIIGNWGPHRMYLPHTLDQTEPGPEFWCPGSKSTMFVPGLSWKEDVGWAALQKSHLLCPYVQRRPHIRLLTSSPLRFYISLSRTQTGWKGADPHPQVLCVCPRVGPSVRAATGSYGTVI